jgi:uncharacterized hydantoinase/oxoprolinase family protein
MKRAIANCVAPGQIAGETLALIVDIGSTTTGLTLMRDGCLLACRQLLGDLGQRLTRARQRPSGE